MQVPACQLLLAHSPVQRGNDGPESRPVRLICGDARHQQSDSRRSSASQRALITEALKLPQACNTLPETGVTDVRTWKKLMHPGAEPSDILALYSNDETDDDMQACEGKVWLLGEQRWAKIG